MDLAKDILDVAEKVGQAPGLAIASSIVTSILKTVETSKNNTLRLKTLAHSLASQLIDISENMKGQWDDAPLTLKRAVDEYDAFLLEMLGGITRLSQYSRLRAFLLAGECEREITRLEKRVTDVRLTAMLLIGMNLSVAMNQVRNSLVSYGDVGQELHSEMQRLVNGARRLNVEPEGHQMTPDFSLFSREDFQVTKTIFREEIGDQQHPDSMKLTIHRAERCINGRAILVKTFEGNDSRRILREFTKELEMKIKSLNPALLQIIGWSSATAQIPFHVYHAPGGIIEPFWTWAERTLRSNPVETIFGLYDMRHSIKELFEFRRSRKVEFGDTVFRDGVVNIQHRGDRPRFSLIHTGRFFYSEDFLYEEPSRCDYYEYTYLNYPQVFARFRSSYEHISDSVSAATLASMFAGAASDWFEDPRGIDSLFQGSYNTIDPLQLGPALLEAGWLSTSSMYLEFQGGLRLGDVGYLAQDGHFEVVANVHGKLISRTGGLPGWTYEPFRYPKAAPEDEDVVVTYSEKLYRRYQHSIASEPYQFSIAHGHRVKYIDLDEKHAWNTLHEEAFCIIEANCLSIAPHELQLLTSITDVFRLWIERTHNWITMAEPTEQREFLPDPATITVYEFEREGLLSVLDSGVPEINAQVFYSFQDNVDGLDPTEIQQHLATGVRQDLHDPFYIEYLQLPLGVTRPSGIEETPD